MTKLPSPHCGPAQARDSDLTMAPANRHVSSSRTVQIEIIGGMAAIDPPPSPDLIRDRLEYRDTIVEPGGPLGHQSREVTSRLYDIDGRGRLIVGAGNVPGIVDVLRQHGHRVTIRNHRRRPPRCQQTNESLLAELTDHEQRLVQAVMANPLGQIVVRGQGETVRAIEILCRHWLEAIVLMPVATRRRVNEVYDALGAPLRGAVSKAHGGTWASNSGRIICTYRSLETVESDKIDIVIFTEPDSMFNQKVFRAIRDLPGEILRYAVIQAEKQLDLASQVRLESLCGPVIWRSPDPRGEAAGVRVMVCEGPYIPAEDYDGALDRKQRAIWHNTPRNRMVAEIAAALAAGKLEPLWKHGIGLENDQIALGDGTPARVAVLVESPAHGRSLQKLLPGWPLLAMIPTAQGGGNAANNSNNSGILLLPDRSIVTVIYASKMPQFDPSVLIVANADDWTREIMSFPPRSRQPVTAPLPEMLVVDLADDYDDIAIRNTQQRLDAYRCRGWRVTAPRRWMNPVEPTGRSLRHHRP